MTSRRRFLRQLGYGLGGGLAAGSGAVPPHLLPEPLRMLWTAGHPQPQLSVVDAGAVRVSPGLWIPGARVPGVRIEFLRLRMPDGVTLAANLFLPDPLPRSSRIPSLIKVHPYRKDDGTLGGDMVESGFYARNGYAALRLDVRGTGGSEGIPEDEYTAQEHEDTVHVIDWLSKQPWCNGNVGMFGLSYSAFNSVQIAMLEPPALKAILAMHGTDDRYTDDVHYMGGVLQVIEQVWGIGMIRDNTMPGAPDYDVHSQASVDRFETPPWLIRWLREQTDGPYWRHGSVRPDYDALRIPTYLLGGWLDGYQNFVPRIMRRSPAVTKGLIGPWKHNAPDSAAPGPAIDFRNQVALRWWDHWLKGIDTGLLDEPRVTYYMPRWHRQSFVHTDDIPGEWRHRDGWPDTAYEPDQRLYLRPSPETPADRALRMDPAPGRGGRLAGESGPASALRLRYHPPVGARGKTFAPTGSDGWYGLDQREDDVHGLVFDTDPLPDDTEILGFARARLWVSATAPVATWIVRLCDVAPDGTSYFLTRGVLNGTHRYSHASPVALTPGEVYPLEIELNAIGWTFPAGHRIRVVVTNADWPHVWPSPHPMETVLHTGGDRSSHVQIPLLRDTSSRTGPQYRPPPPLDFDTGVDGTSVPNVWNLQRDEAAGLTSLQFSRGSETTRHPIGIRIAETDAVVATVRDLDPAHASLQVDAFTRIEMDGRTLETRVEGSLSSTHSHFMADIESVLLEDGRPVRKRHWEERAPRNLG